MQWKWLCDDDDALLHTSDLSLSLSLYILQCGVIWFFIPWNVVMTNKTLINFLLRALLSSHNVIKYSPVLCWCFFLLSFPLSLLFNAFVLSEHCFVSTCCVYVCILCTRWNFTKSIWLLDVPFQISINRTILAFHSPDSTLLVFFFLYFQYLARFVYTI